MTSLTPTDAVDRFLKREAHPSVYSQIKAVEPCIVEQGSSRSIRFAVITNSSVLLTENPPKKLSELSKLLDIIAIDQVLFEFKICPFFVF
jgi:hypothetical protein